MRNASGRQKVKMSGREKKANRSASSKFFMIFSMKRVTRKFHVATTSAKKMYKKSCCSLFVCFFAVLVIVAVEHSTIIVSV